MAALTVFMTWFTINFKISTNYIYFFYSDVVDKIFSWLYDGYS